MATGQDHKAGVPRELMGTRIELATPRKLPKPDELVGRVAVLDIAFAAEAGGSRNGFERTTLRFIERLGPRLVAWVDHHDSQHHARFSDDRRFVLARKALHGACPEMITEDLVRAVGGVDTIVCHSDFDGLASAAKWLLGGREPYPGCDADARAVDTRVGTPGPTGSRFDRALRAAPRDDGLQRAILALLVGGLSGDASWARVEVAGAALAALEEASRRLSAGYRQLGDELLWVDVSGHGTGYDKTELLLLGQARARMVAVADGDTITFAAPFDSGVSFVDLFGLSGGMPTMVSIPRSRLASALASLGVAPAEAAALAAQR